MLMSYASLSPSIPKRNASNDRSFVTISGSHFICIVTLIRIDINNDISSSSDILLQKAFSHPYCLNFTRLLGRGALSLRS